MSLGLNLLSECRGIFLSEMSICRMSLTQWAANGFEQMQLTGEALGHVSQGSRTWPHGAVPLAKVQRSNRKQGQLFGLTSCCF